MASVSSFLTFAFCLLPFALIVLSSQTQKPPVFRAGAVLVTVDAYPQQDGRIVEGLASGDFEVLEDGKPQKVENLEFIRVEPALTDQARRDPNTVAEANALAGDPRSRVFVAYLDTYHVAVEGSYFTRKPLVETLNRILAPGDLFGVMTPAMRPSDIAFSRKILTVEEQLTKYWPWGERFQVMHDAAEDQLISCFGPRLVPDGAVMKALAQQLILRRREDATLTSLEKLIAHLGGLREARTVVLLFTDGWLLYEPDSAIQPQSGAAQTDAHVLPNGRLIGEASLGQSGDVTHACDAELFRLADLHQHRRMRDLMAEANRRNVSFYPVNPGGLAVFDAPMSERVVPNKSAPASQTILGQDRDRLRSRIEGLKTLADNTDGLAVTDTNDLGAGLRRVADDVSAYYLLGYYSTNTKMDGAYRRIQVRMKRPNATIKARRGYFAPSPEKPAPPATTDGSFASAASSATSSLVNEALASLARLRPTADMYTYGVPSGTELALVAELSSAQAALTKWAPGADVQVAVTSASGAAVGTATARIDPGTRGVLLRVPLNAESAGPWNANVKISGAGEAVEDRIIITRAPATPLLGEPMVYRAAPGPRAPLRPVADFQFRRTERVHIEWPMIVSVDDRQARLLSRTGQPLPVSVTVTVPPSLAVLAVDANLAPLGAGDYIIEVTAGAGDKSERRLIAIRVVQ